MGKQIYSNKFMLTETYKAVSSQFSFVWVHSFILRKMSKSAYKQSLECPSNCVYIVYGSIWSCLLVKNKVMPIWLNIIEVYGGELLRSAQD